MKILLRLMFPLRGINASLQRLVALYEADLRERNIVLPDPKAARDMTELTYETVPQELDQD